MRQPGIWNLTIAIAPPARGLGNWIAQRVTYGRVKAAAHSRMLVFSEWLSARLPLAP